MVSALTSLHAVDPDSACDKDRLGILYRRPGFLIRRAHQITVSIFLEEAADLGITTSQYGAMVVLNARSGLDQAALSKLVGIDRSTTALVIGKLEAAGYVVRKCDPDDKRRKELALTDEGRATLERAAEPAQRTRERELAVFSPEDRKTFVRLLETFVMTFNAETRAPIKARTTTLRRGKRSSRDS